VHYWGNAIGESGNSGTDALVNLTDVARTRGNQTGFSLTDVYALFDYNRDRKVNLTDVAIARNNQSGFSPLRLLSVPGGEGEAVMAAVLGEVSSEVGRRAARPAPRGPGAAVLAAAAGPEAPGVDRARPGTPAGLPVEAPVDLRLLAARHALFAGIGETEPRRRPATGLADEGGTAAELLDGVLLELAANRVRDRIPPVEKA
jgi:hypothetical protein